MIVPLLCDECGREEVEERDDDVSIWDPAWLSCEFTHIIGHKLHGDGEGERHVAERE